VATLPEALASRFAQTIARAEDTHEERAAARDDATARRDLALLYERHAPRVQRFLRDVLGDDALAWDATQETFARAFGHPAILKDGEHAAPWLFGVARNVSFELRRARFRAGRVIASENGELERAKAKPGACPEAEYLGREALRVIDAALLRLSEDRRAVLLLRLDHGLAYDQIAELMGWTLAKVKIEIFRAREVLRETMAEYETSDGGGR
jgi:RNA polymerase sigma-70 factor (ECF subfamily)